MLFAGDPHHIDRLPDAAQVDAHAYLLWRATEQGQRLALAPVNARDRTRIHNDIQEATRKAREAAKSRKSRASAAIEAHFRDPGE